MARSLVLAFLVLLAQVAPLTAQTFGELVGAGRYEEAAALLTDVSPEEAQAGAMQIYDHAYGTHFRAGAWQDAIRGFVAARQVPHLSERQTQQFDFWHAQALVNSIRGDTIQPPQLTHDETVSMLEQAYDLLLASRDYSWGINQSYMINAVGRMLDQALQAR